MILSMKLELMKLWIKEEIEMEYSQIIIVAILIEAIWENCKIVWQNNKFSWDKVGALMVSIFICIGVQADVFGLVGLNIVWPILPNILTGILVSRGANFIHDIF